MLGLNTMTFLINSCVYDGGDIGSTGWNRRVENCRMTPLLVKLVNANDNANYGDYALAA
jgi:hypothetical protein